MRVRNLLAAVAVAGSAALVWSQEPTPAVSTTPVPGAGDGTAYAREPANKWEKWVEEYSKVIRVPKGLAYRVDERHAYPDVRVKALMEIVGEDDTHVYLRNLPLEDPRSAGYPGWLVRQRIEARSIVVADRLRDQYFLENLEVEPPAPTTDRVAFEPRSQGLPAEGLWQIGFDVADFDGDARLDLALPPARKGVANPWVILNGTEGWKPWTATWPSEVSFDYGDVKAADFDRDGNLDLATASHFKEAHVLYGDGRGNFTRFVRLDRPNSNVTSRALALADFDGDGRTDVVQLSELDVQIDSGKRHESGLVIVNLNTAGGWQVAPASFPANIYGDHVTTGDFNGDGKPDILLASHKANNDAYIFLNDGAGTSFTAYRHNFLPYASYVLGVASASLDRKKPDQVVIAVEQTVRREGGSYYFVHAVLAYRIADRKGRLLKEPERRVLYRDQISDTDQFRALAVGDLDQDGRPDVVAGRSLGGLLVLLQMPDSSFAVQPTRDLGLGDASPNHVLIRDLDRDGRPEMIVNFSDGKETPGSVKAWTVSRKSAARTAQKPAN